MGRMTSVHHGRSLLAAVVLLLLAGGSTIVTAFLVSPAYPLIRDTAAQLLSALL